MGGCVKPFNGSVKTVFSESICMFLTVFIYESENLNLV